ncbi:uncharacterized protein LOC120198762 [Hibiscus syriacus]|uniref:uncharacterized protein LOC120198762 n=1 Tax=Hibiscus syriacus TaxID=106335 RepID=UPI0019241C33|nr:uncharacterized protein LOC120198762 [Hibiscus syriacus]
MGLNGGGNSMGQGHYPNWGCKKESKYKGVKNGYAMGYSGSECSQIHNPTTYGMSKPQNVYGMAETWDEFGQSYGNYKSQNGPSMSKTQLDHVPGNGYGKMQSYGYGNNNSHGKHEGRVYGYGMGHGFANHGHYESYEETDGYEEYAMNGIVRSQPHRLGNHSGHGNGFMTPQSYGPAKIMGFECTEPEYSETRFSNDSQYYGGGRVYHGGNGHSAKGLMKNNSGESSRSDSESDDEDNHHGGFNKVWKSKAI